MQPYLFPYIGYFQLIHSSDLFLIYDDVTYIKQGYINRNSILTGAGSTRFTIPVPGASSNKLISSLEFSKDVSKALRTIEQSYSKKKYFDDVFPIIKDVLEFESRSIADVCEKSYLDILAYLDLKREFIKTSELNYNRTLPAKEKLFYFCNKFSADEYVNTPGGKSLYKRDEFLEQGIKLEFISSGSIEYDQGKREFYPNLSIIDVLMSCSVSDVRAMLKKFTLD